MSFDNNPPSRLFPIFQAVTRKSFPAIFLIPCLLMFGCSNESDRAVTAKVARKEASRPVPMKQIKLENGNLQATFSLPKTYVTENASDTVMLFHAAYPGMGPSGQNGSAENDEIDVYVWLVDKPQSTTESLVAEATDAFDPKQPGKAYRAGKQGDYRIFRQRRGNGDARVEVTIYAFTASDGSLVGVEDAGQWAANYEAERKIGNNLHVRYRLPKPLGQDFKKIDEAVTSFIKSHLETGKESPRLKS